MTTIGGAPFPSILGCLGAGLTGHSGHARSGPFNRPKMGASRLSSASFFAAARTLLSWLSRQRIAGNAYMSWP